LSLNALYLHGFASSPDSSKAIRLANALTEIGVATSIPDLNEPDFRTLTVTRMIAQVRAEMSRALKGRATPTILIGSSLGAFVAVNTAAVDSRVKALVLLAPALEFGADERGNIGTVSIAAWRDAGQAEVFHYARNRPEMLDYTLYEDAKRYDAFALTLAIPILVFQGTRDTVVDPEAVKRWASARSNVRLELVEDDHQLQTSLDVIAQKTVEFLSGLSRTP
jgi:pimeloyl-ACP methyl ester carboxylesterase